MRLVSSAALGLLIATYASMSSIATPSLPDSPCAPPAPLPIQKAVGICPAH